MNKIMSITALILALGVSACSAEIGDSEGAAAETETEAALTVPAGFGFYVDAAKAANGPCTDLNGCYLQHDKKVNWKRGPDGSSGPKFGIHLSDLFADELNYQKNNAPGWNIINDSAAEDIVEDVTLPGTAQARMLPSGQIDNPNNANPPGGQRHMFHRCRVQIDLTKIEQHLNNSTFDQVNRYAHNMVRREMFACLGLGRGGQIGNGPMIAGTPETFRDSLKDVTAAQKTKLQSYAP